MNAQTIGPIKSGNQRRIGRRIIELLTAALLCLCFNSINSQPKIEYCFCFCTAGASCGARRDMQGGTGEIARPSHLCFSDALAFLKAA